MSSCLCGAQDAVRLFTACDRLYRTTTKEFPVVRCLACGLWRLDPQPAPDELSLYYPKGYWFAPSDNASSRLEEAYRRLVLRDHVRFVERALHRAAPRVLSRIPMADARGSETVASCDREGAMVASGLPATGPVLDVGCGGGLFLGMLRERGFQVAGLDISSEAAGIAWRRHGVPSVCGSLEQVPFRAESFATVTMFHVLEHLADPRSYLAAAYRLLRPGGSLVVQVPNAASWQSRLLGRAWYGIDAPRHLFDFRDCDIERLLVSCGFQVVRRKYFSLRDNPAGLASSLAPALDPTVRRVRRIPEGGGLRLAKHLLYFSMLVAAVPFTILEAACRAGSTVMIEARKL